MNQNYKTLNRDQIKILAVVLMTFNHIAHFLLAPGTLIYEIFEDIGYFTSITMCWFLVEGYNYTHSKKLYAKRLLVFALVSEIPYILCHGYFQLNVIFTLLICFIILCIMDAGITKFKKILSIIPLVLTSLLCDCALILPIAAILFKRSRGNNQKQVRAYLTMCVIFFLLNVPGYAPSDAPYPFLSGYALLHSFFAVIPWIISGVMILVLYNGKKSESHLKFHKWFFYIYYPAHLFLIWTVSLILKI